MSISSGALTGPAWYVVHTKSKQESVAKENLERQQFTTYLPRVRTLLRRRGKLQPIIEPFFPRYIFVRFDRDNDDWAPIRSTRGVIGVVRFDGVARPVPESFIETMRANENPESLQMMEEAEWRPGQSVVIEQGPFAGYRGIFKKRTSEERVILLLNIVGKQTQVALPRRDLQLPRYASAR